MGETPTPADPISPTEAARLFWCKRKDGTIVETVTDAYSGHEGHVHCVPMGDREAAGDPDA